jgi:hypothetical protein
VCVFFAISIPVGTWTPLCTSICSCPCVFVCVLNRIFIHHSFHLPLQWFCCHPETWCQEN